MHSRVLSLLEGIVSINVDIKPVALTQLEYYILFNMILSRLYTASQLRGIALLVQTYRLNTARNRNQCRYKAPGNNWKTSHEPLIKFYGRHLFSDIKNHRIATRCHIKYHTPCLWWQQSYTGDTSASIDDDQIERRPCPFRIMRRKNFLSTFRIMVELIRQTRRRVLVPAFLGNLVACRPML